MIQFKCPKCSDWLNVPASLLGKKEICPTCGNVAIVTLEPIESEIDAMRQADHALRSDLVRDKGRDTYHPAFAGLFKVALICLLALGVIAWANARPQKQSPTFDSDNQAKKQDIQADKAAERQAQKVLWRNQLIQEADVQQIVDRQLAIQARERQLREAYTGVLNAFGTITAAFAGTPGKPEDLSAALAAQQKRYEDNTASIRDAYEKRMREIDEQHSQRVRDANKLLDDVPKE